MNLKRFTSFALALILCFALAPVNADALASENDAVKNGYYDSSGQWVEGKLQQTLPEGIHSVNKTATPVADNTYEVTLEVVTKQKVESFTKKSATVLVLDTSKSMNDDSRLKTLKNSAAEFITTYAGKKENTGRYLAVVQFSTGTKVVLNWTDVSTEQGKKSAIDSIQALKANEGTNLQAGLKQASSLFKQSTVQEIQKENRNTVVLTDGAPTYYLEKCSGGIFTWTHTHVVIDGVIYDEKGSGSSGSQNIIDLTTKDAKVLKDESKVYTVCYGAQNQTTYKGGPLVSDFLADNIAQSSDTAFIAGKTEDLMKVFEAISESVVSGITGENLTVTDGSAPFVTVSNLPTTIQQDENGFTWKLTNATTTTEGNQTYYTYQLKYTVKLDVDNAEFKEENWYPLNGKTEINMPSGEKVKFPIPAAQGTKTRYTVTYTDGVDNEEVFKDKVFENIVTGSKTPDFGEIPVRDGYTFKGWSPQIEDTVTKTVVYNATWDMNLIDLNIAPTITATDKVLTVGDTFDPKADVTASDKEDGDITANLEVVKNEVDTTKAGVYEVTYKVTDSQGASYTTTIQVTVNPKMETLNEAPIITATDKTITVGDTFDPKADVTASDKEDGDITANLEVVKNEVDTTKAGVYEVTYKATDSQGASYTKTIKVTVKERKISTPNTDKEKKPNNGGDKINNTGNPKTGDQTNVGLFTSLLVISALGIAILAVFKKKKALEHK